MAEIIWDADQQRSISDLFLYVEELDELLTVMFKDAFQSLSDNPSYSIDSSYIMQATKTLLDFRSVYHDAPHEPRFITGFLLGFPNQRVAWQTVLRIMVRFEGMESSFALESSSWMLWAKHVQAAGQRLANQAVKCSGIISNSAGPLGMDNLIDHLEDVDNLLQVLSPDHDLERLSDQLRDNLLALIEIVRRGSVADQTTVELFRSQIRARRATIAAGIPAPQEQIDNAGVGLAQNACIPDQWKPATGGITLLLILIALPFVVLGWQRSPNESGSSEDADFWFLIQSMLMQTASIVSIVIGFRTNPVQNRQASLWIWTFISISGVCTAIAPILYVTVPTGWSALAGYMGSIAIAFVILEAMFVPQHSEKKND